MRLSLVYLVFPVRWSQDQRNVELILIKSQTRGLSLVEMIQLVFILLIYTPILLYLPALVTLNYSTCQHNLLHPGGFLLQVKRRVRFPSFGSSGLKLQVLLPSDNTPPLAHWGRGRGQSEECCWSIRAPILLEPARAHPPLPGGTLDRHKHFLQMFMVPQRVNHNHCEPPTSVSQLRSVKLFWFQKPD